MNEKKPTEYVFRNPNDGALTITQESHYSGEYLYSGTRLQCLDFIDKWNKTHDWFSEAMKRDEKERHQRDFEELQSYIKDVQENVQEYVNAFLRKLRTEPHTMEDTEVFYSEEAIKDALLHCSAWKLTADGNPPKEINNECRKVD